MKGALIGLSLLALVAGCASKQAVPTPDANAPVKFGGRVVSVPTGGLPLVSFRIAFQAGSIDDPPFKEGITSLAADLIAKGGTKDLDSSQLLQALFPMAGEIDTQTDKELTVFYGTVHKDHVAKYLPLLIAALTTPRYDPKEFARLREDAVQDIEKRLRSGDDENLGKAALDSLIYEGGPYATYTGGTVQGLKGITLDDVKAHVGKVFTQERMIIGLAGAVDDAMVHQLKMGLSALPGSGLPLRTLPNPPASGPKALLVEKDAASTAFSLGYPYSLKRSDPDFHLMMVAGSALGEHRQFNGRLMRELRMKRGLNYGDYAYVEHFSQEGWGSYPRTNIGRRQQDFTIWLRPVVNENRLFALRAALYNFDDFVKKGMTPDEFETAKGFLAGYTLLFEQTPMRRLGYAIDDVFDGTKDHLGSFRASLAKMTVNDVNNAIKRHLDPGKLRLAVVTKDAEGFKQAIVAGAPSSIKYPADNPDPAVVAEDLKFTSMPLPFKASDIVVRPVGELFEK